MGKNDYLLEFEKAIKNRKATWWKMELPSCQVSFGDAKAEMLGRSPEEFKKYQDFTALLNPKDYDKAMKAMQDHLDGKKEYYEVKYRIKNKNGRYITFLDLGKILFKDGKKITVLGFVFKVNNDKKEKYFTDLIKKGKLSIPDLVLKIIQ
jgi:PAS domain S-box-containing protein